MKTAKPLDDFLPQTHLAVTKWKETIDFDGWRVRDINYTIKHSTRQLYANINSSDPVEVPTSL
jgi:hypothetical protein